MRPALWGGALALLCLFARPALAGDTCKPLQMLGSADIGVENSNVYVNVTINGKPARMLLSTAGGTTGFTPQGAAALGLPLVGSARVIIINSKNKSSEHYAVIDDLSVGGAHIAHSQYMVLPSSGSANADVVGVMSPDLLSHFDVELDFAAGKLNLFAQDHCPGKVIYWKHAAVSVVPLSKFQPTTNDSRTGYQGYMKRFEQMWVPVTLDGKNLPAQLSTTGGSNMQSNAALGTFNVDTTSPGSQPLPDRSDMFRHKFSQLVFDGVAVSNPDFLIYDTHPAKFTREIRRTDTRLARLDDGSAPSVVVGMDILTKLHLFASFGEGKLYITEASGPPKALSQAPANGAAAAP